MQVRPSLKFIKLSYLLGLILALAIGVYIGAGSNPPAYTIWLLAVPAVILILALSRHVRRRLVTLTVQGDLLRYEEGLFSKTTRSVELSKVQDVRVDQSLGQRMAGIGDLSLETAGGGSRIEIQSIDRPQWVADRILALARGQRQMGGEESVSQR
jgi:uncharacterized membrane protein YdbT with pleckstrin-like domain